MQPRSARQRDAGHESASDRPLRESSIAAFNTSRSGSHSYAGSPTHPISGANRYAAIGRWRTCSRNRRNSGPGTRHIVRYVYRKGSQPFQYL